MVRLSPWTSFYRVLPDGRSWIDSAKLTELESMDHGRILDVTLKSKRSKAIFLDKPYLLGLRGKIPGVTGFFLHRIHLRDLPGWPPRIAPDVEQPRFPGALRCSMKSARFKPGDEGAKGKETVEFELECGNQVYKAWMADCPEPLLRSVEATLKQDGVAGKNLADLQEMRLIGAE